MIRKPAIVAKAFSIPCVVWSCSVPIYYAVTRDDKSIIQLSRSVMTFGEPDVLQFAVALLFLFVQFIAVPYGLLVALRVVWARLDSPVLQGTLAGLCYGMWANTVFLALPYIGAYPSIASFGLLSLLGRNSSLQHFPLLITNILVAISFGILLTLRHAQMLRDRPKAGFCKVCKYDLTGNVSGTCPECGAAVNEP